MSENHPKTDEKPTTGLNVPCTFREEPICPYCGGIFWGYQDVRPVDDVATHYGCHFSALFPGKTLVEMGIVYPENLFWAKDKDLIQTAFFNRRRDK